MKKGIVALHSNGLKWAFKWLYLGYFKTNTFYLYKKELSEDMPEVPNYDNVAIKMIPIKVLKSIRKSRRDLPIEFYCDVFDGANTCFVAFVNEKPAHIRWVYFKEDYSRYFKLKEGEAEFAYAITLPEFRGLRISFLTAMASCQWLKSNKYNRVYVSIHANNINAIKSVKRQGFKKIAEIKRYGVLPFINKYVKVNED